MKQIPNVRITRSGLCLALFAATLLEPASTARASTFGTFVTIGGHAADLALDEARGVLYVANFGGSRIDVMSLASHNIKNSIHVAAYPGAISLSPDGQFLVVAHFGNFVSPGTPQNALTVVNLVSGGKQTFTLGDPPLGIAFGTDAKALLVTTTQFLLFEPASGSVEVLDTIAGVTARTLPVPPATFPPQVIAASLGVSADGFWIYGLTDTIRFRYDVLNRVINSVGYTSDPPQGPRVVSVSRDGSYFIAGLGAVRSGRAASVAVCERFRTTECREPRDRFRRRPDLRADPTS
jgi:DNA-binding beta-propeller fold protein YncE